MIDFEYPDAVIRQPRGRGAGQNPGNRFESLRLHVLGDVLDETRRECPAGIQLRTKVYADHSRRVLTPVQSPDLGFNWTLNPYRGCEHGCVYCYARPTHETLGFSCGLDFESRIVAKYDAHRLLRAELANPRWSAETIVMSGVTDAYQPLESRLLITRRCLEVMVESRQPVAIATKNRLVTRDLDLLVPLARHRAAVVAISLTTLDRKLAASMEPRASRPADRLRAIRELAAAGVPVSVLLAPVIPGLTDREIPALLEAAAEAGATSAGWVMLRLPHQVKSLFLDWLKTDFPRQSAKVEHLVRGLHDGRLYDSRFGVRQRGQGPIADQIAETFRVFAKRYRLNTRSLTLSSKAFRRPGGAGQMTLF